jgi:hypothetical protein
LDCSSSTAEPDVRVGIPDAESHLAAAVPPGTAQRAPDVAGSDDRDLDVWLLCGGVPDGSVPVLIRAYPMI